MSETKIPKHRHQVETRSAAPRTIEGGDDDAPAPAKRPAKSEPESGASA